MQALRPVMLVGYVLDTSRNQPMGAQGFEATPRIVFAPLEKFVGHSLKTIGNTSKNLGPSRKTLRPS